MSSATRGRRHVPDQRARTRHSCPVRPGFRRAGARPPHSLTSSPAQEQRQRRLGSPFFLQCQKSEGPWLSDHCLACNIADHQQRIALEFVGRAPARARPASGQIDRGLARSIPILQIGGPAEGGNQRTLHVVGAVPPHTIGDLPTVDHVAQTRLFGADPVERRLRQILEYCLRWRSWAWLQPASNRCAGTVLALEFLVGEAYQGFDRHLVGRLWSRLTSSILAQMKRSIRPSMLV